MKQDISVKKIRGFELVTYAQQENIKREQNGQPFLFRLPCRSTKHAAAYDMFSPVEIILQPNETYCFKTGIKMYCRSNEALFILTRSGNGSKRRITLANNLGLIDADYYNNPDNEGELLVTIANEGTEPFHIAIGDKFCQVYFQNILLADNDEYRAQTRQGGYGSTGK